MVRPELRIILRDAAHLDARNAGRMAGKMADLLREYDATFQTAELPQCKVMAVGEDGKFRRWPQWLLSYRRPELTSVNGIRCTPCEDCGKLSHECPCIDALIAKTSAELEAEQAKERVG